MKTMKKLLAWLLCVTLMLGMLGGLNLSVTAVVTVWDGSIADSFESGSGTEDDPYIIKTAEQLAYLSKSVSEGNSYEDTYFRLDGDILLNDTTNWEQWGSNNESNELIAPVNLWIPIGGKEFGKYFLGVFDGDHHTVYGMCVIGSDYCGLFGASGCEIRNLSVAESYVEGTFNAGSIVSKGNKVINCFNSGTVVNGGGIAGSIDGSIIDCGNSGKVSGGGIAGSAYGEIIGCFNTGTVTKAGIVCSASYCTISNCFNTGEVSGSTYIGGIAGNLYSSVILDCYNTGTVRGKGIAGGIVGSPLESTITCCYNAGSIKWTGDGAYSSLTVGDILGQYDRTVKWIDCYRYSGTTEGNDYYINYYGYVLSDEQMRNKDSFVNWDFNKSWEIAYDQDYPYPTLICFGSKNYSYRFTLFDGENCTFDELVNCNEAFTLPSLSDKDDLDFVYWLSGKEKFNSGDTIIPEKDMTFRAVRMARNTSEKVWDGSVSTHWEGEGTEESPYLISTAAELAGMTELTDSDGLFFRQTEDIVLNDRGDLFSEYVIGKNKWQPITNGSFGFKGTYDGNGFTVSGMFIDETDDNCGLFRSLYGARIHDLSVADFYVSGDDGLGGLAGSAYESEISNCSLNGIVTGDNYTGGIIGSASCHSTVTKSRFMGTVKGYEYVGGILGEAYDNTSFINCYNSGSVNGDSWVGGLAGYSRDHISITNSYNSGSVNGRYAIGGISGELRIDSSISFCYNSGIISGDDYCGNIAGKNNSNSYASDCYYLSRYIRDENILGTSLSHEQMQDPESFADWNFKKSWIIGSNEDYPYPTLRCFSNESISFEVRLYDGDELVSYETVSEGDSVILPSISEKNGLDPGYWASADETIYGVGDTITPEDDVTLRAVRTTRNASANVWNGSYDANWSGSGTEDDPYLISTAEQLAAISKQLLDNKLDHDVYFRQTANIYLNDGGELFTESVAGKNLWTPTAYNYNYNDTYNYDGCGFFVSGLYVRQKEPYGGLFGRIGGYVKNLRVIDSYVKGGRATGGIAGSASGEISNCSFSGKVYGTGDCTGGIAGEAINYCVINCKNLGNIIGSGDKVGGIAGGTYLSNDDYCTDCINTGNIEGNDYVGGISGYTYGNGNSGCTNTGNVIGNDYVGGISGYCSGNGNTGAKNLGNITGRIYVGGVSGNGSISNGTNSGTVAGQSYVGGVVGYGDILGCSNTGKVTYDEQADNGQNNIEYIGGVAGYSTGEADSCFNKGVVIGKKYTGGVSGSGYSFTDCYNTGIVSGEKYTGGVSSGNDSSGVVSKCYNTGEVSGDINTGGVYGGSIILNDCHNAGKVSGGDATGGICSGGSGNGREVKNCYNEGIVSGGNSVGGIIGGWGSAVNCYNTGVISGNDRIGGIGGNIVDVTNSYNTGKVSGNTYVGGIIGRGSKTTCCYNIGRITGTGNDERIGAIVGDISGSSSPNSTYDGFQFSYYLNTCVSGGNAYGTLLTTEQMKTKEAFTGFDFSKYWEFGVVADYDYPTLTNAEYDNIIKHTVTFLDSDGTVLKRQTVKNGYDAVPPTNVRESYSDGSYYHTFERWDGNYKKVYSDSTVTAIYKQVAIIKFTDFMVPISVGYGFSKDNLKVQLEAYLSRVLCSTTNGYKMKADITWDENDLNAYDPQDPGDYIIHGSLKITDSPYYDMAEGAEVRAIVTIQPADEAPQEFTQDDLTYTVIDGQHAMVTGYTGNAAEIMLPSKLGGYTVTQIAEGAFAYNDSLTSVTIPSSVVSVGKDAFADCSSLLMVTFEEGVEIIGDGAFRNTSLICVTLSQSIEYIGKQAFGYYGENEAIQGFAVYCYQDTVGVQYAKENSFECFTVNGQMDEESGISAVVEDDLTLVVSPVTDGAYYETAQQIVQENDDVSLFNIKTVDSHAQEVQPGNILTVSIPVPTGFDAALCKVYRVNSDGSVMNMNARVVGGKLVFNTAHLSCYAVVEDVVTPPVEKKVTPLTVLLEAKDGYEYRISGGNWQSDPLFDGLEPETEYTFYSRIAAKDGTPSSVESAGIIIKTAESEHHKLSGYINKNSGRLGEVIFELSREGKEPIILSSWSKVYSFDSLESGHYFMRITSELGEEAIAIVDIDDKDVTIDIQIERIPGSENMFILGDVSGDGSVMITDATFVQRYIVGIETPFTKRQLMHADIDRSGELEIMDVTAIQYYLASMKTGYEIGWLV